MSDFENAILAETISDEGPCLEATLLKAARSVYSDDIPEDFAALRLDGYTCPFTTDMGQQCRLSNPMVFMKKGVGFTAIGTTNLCELGIESPKQFKKESTPDFRIQLKHIGRKLLALVARS